MSVRNFAPESFSEYDNILAILHDACKSCNATSFESITGGYRMIFKDTHSWFLKNSWKTELYLNYNFAGVIYRIHLKSTLLGFRKSYNDKYKYSIKLNNVNEKIDFGAFYLDITGETIYRMGIDFHKDEYLSVNAIKDWIETSNYYIDKYFETL